MSLSPAKIRSNKVTHTFALENADCCEIEITPVATDNVVYQYRFRMSSKSHTHKKLVEIEAASTQGKSSIKVLIEALKIIDGIKYKNVSIYYKSDYAAKTYNELYRLVRSGKVNKSVNKTEIMELYNLAQTVGQRHYITVKTEKVIKLYQHKNYNE